MGRFRGTWFIVGFYAQKIIPGAIGLIILPWAFVRLGGRVYGGYSITFFKINAFSMLAGAWISQAVIRNIRSGSYSRRTLKLALPSLFFSGALASLFACLLEWAGFLGSVHDNLSRPNIFLGLAIFFSASQSALLAIVQVTGRHLFCVASDLVRVVAPVALLVFFEKALSVSERVNLALAIGYGLALLSIVPPVFIIWRDARYEVGGDYLISRLKFLQYGLPLSLYSGSAMWVQYVVRQAMAVAGQQFGDSGLLLLIADLVQRVVNSIFSPLISAFVPKIIAEFNLGGAKNVLTLVKRIEQLIFGSGFFFGCALIVVAMARFRNFSRAPEIECFVEFLGASLFMNASIARQKILELKSQTWFIGVAMVVASAATYLAVDRIHAGVGANIPGLALLVANCGLYFVTVAKARAIPLLGDGVVR